MRYIIKCFHLDLTPLQAKNMPSSRHLLQGCGIHSAVTFPIAHLTCGRGVWPSSTTTGGCQRLAFWSVVYCSSRGRIVTYEWKIVIDVTYYVSFVSSEKSQIHIRESMFLQLDSGAYAEITRFKTIVKEGFCTNCYLLYSFRMVGRQ